MDRQRSQRLRNQVYNMASTIQNPPRHAMWQWRPKLWSYLSFAIRVPPLIVMDTLLAEWSTDPPDSGEYVFLESSLNALVSFLVYSPVFLLSFIAFILETRQLLKVYVFLSSLGVLFWSYIWNQEFVKAAIALTDDQTNVLYECLTLNTNILSQCLANYVFQIFFGITFSFSMHLNTPTRFFWLWIIFIGPTFLSIFSPFIPNSFLIWTPAISAWMAHVVLIYGFILNVPPAVQYVKETIRFSKLVIANEGFFVLLKANWQRLHVPQVLRLFCLSRMLEHASVMIAEAHSTGVFLSWAQLGKQLLVRGCGTTVSVMGMTSIVGVLSHQLSMGVKMFLQMEDADEQNMGTVSAILFFVLAMQCGLTGMDPEKRLNRLYQNVCLLVSAILHFFQSMINSLLQLLGASLNSPREKHVRALLVCAFLIVFPISFIYFAWSRYTLSTWLLALSCFSTEVVVKVIVSLIVYVLFMIDARMDSSWEPFEDYVYAVRAFGLCMELIFGTFLLLNGAWIFFFEQSGTIRAFMIVFHAYFNVWTQARQGWANSVRRREAGKRLAEFRRATSVELSRLNDVCAICHHEMESAIVTDCAHFYHVNCLRRWLFMQNHCPICHTEFNNNNRRRQTPVDLVDEDEGGLFVPPQPPAQDEMHPHYE